VTTTTTNRRKSRAHGEGSLHFDDKRGKWVAEVTLDGDGGKRKRKKMRFDTQAEARQALTKMRADLDAGAELGDHRTTVAVWLDRWLVETVRGPASTLRESTRASYEHQVGKNIKPELGTLTLAQLSAVRLERFLNDKLRSGLSARTVQYLHAIVRSSLNRAVRLGLLQVNVAERVTPPAAPKTDAKHLTTEQAGKLLAALAGDRRNARNEKRRTKTEPERLRLAIVIALSMGLRRGEVVGLRWEHVDLERGVLRVREQLVRVRHVRDADKKIVERRGLVVQALKTDKSRRTLAVPRSVLAELRAHKKAQATALVALGPIGERTGYVFTTELGGPLDGRELLERWHQALADAGVEPMPFHASRHTAASMLLAHGADLRAVMGQLGHSQIALTANTYAHVLEELAVDTADRADAALAAARSRVTS
jgi:integrase